MSDDCLKISDLDESQSPSKISINEKKDNINTKAITEEIIKKRKELSLYTTLTKDYVEEEEKENINIVFKEQDHTIKFITLDLLLKKIVKENFMENNPILIYSFCQQCFCFMDKEIMFNKIFNCYNYYNEKNIPLFQKENIIKFLNVLVIEMYDYYTKIQVNDPILTLLNDIYNSIIDEIHKLVENSLNTETGKDEEEGKQTEDSNATNFEEEKMDEEDTKIEEEGNFNINEYQKTLESCANEDDQEDDEVISDNRNSGILEEMNRNRFASSSFGNREEGRLNSCTKIEEKKGKASLLRKAASLNEDKKSKKEREKEEKERKKKEKEEEKKRKKEEKQKKKEEEKQLKKEGKKKSFLHKLLFNDKEEDKNIKEEKSDKKHKVKKNVIKTKIKQISPEEELLFCLSNIKNLFLFEAEQRDINAVKNSIDFFKDVKKKIAQAIGKPFPEENNRHAFSKSTTVENITKNFCLDRKIENDGFFNVSDWEPKYIGEKLIQISKRLLKKIHRKELYKTVFLKKDKEINSPNVMENIDKFNRLTFFIIQDILSYDFAKDRGKIIDKWIDIAEYCRKRKDYNDCIAIISALNNYIIKGLQKTMNDISKDKKELLSDINHFCRYKGNYKKLRESIKSLKPNEFYIPYLGMILKDLAFYEENYKYMDEIFINFEKLEKVELEISDFFGFKNTVDKESSYIPEEFAFFDKLEDIKEADLEALANQLEPAFQLYENKKREKRPTNIDKKYFCDSSVVRPNMRDSKRLKNKQS